MFVRDNHLSWRVEPYEWTNDTPDKYERLLGIYENLDIEQRRYKDKIQMVDNILGVLLSTCDPNDSTLSPERIWKPTLLVFAPNHKNFSGAFVSQELV